MREEEFGFVSLTSWGSRESSSWHIGSQGCRALFSSPPGKGWAVGMKAVDGRSGPLELRSKGNSSSADKIVISSGNKATSSESRVCPCVHYCFTEEALEPWKKLLGIEAGLGGSERDHVMKLGDPKQKGPVFISSTFNNLVELELEETL